MALTFPSSPVDGQLYIDSGTGNRYIYDSGKGLWKYASNNVGMTVGTAPPPSASVAPGAMWYNTNTGRTFILYDDGDSRQWVENVPAVGSFDSSTVAGYANAAVLPAVTPAFNKANTALQNTSGTFAGSLTATGDVTSGGTITALSTVQSSAGADLSLNANGANRDVIAKVNGTELLKIIGSTGNMGLGYSHDPGNTLKYFDIQNANTGSSAGAIIRLITANTTGLALTTVDIVKYKNGLFSINNNDTAGTFAFNNGGAERMRITNSELSLAGLQGIKFQASQSASSDANTLDDYEEGTFTAYFAGNNSGTAMFSGTNAYGLANPGTNGKYTKIGRRVYFNFYLLMAGTFSWANGYGGATSVWIAGLPFVESSSTGVGGVYPAVNCGYNVAPGGWSAAYAAMGIIESGLSTIRVGYMGTNAFTQASASSFASGGSAMIWSGHYETTT
jgi:hypothetical protein